MGSIKSPAEDPLRKRFDELDVAQRRDYIDWVDRWYRYHFRRDIPPPSARPVFWGADVPRDERERYTWDGADVAAWLRVDRRALPGYVNALDDPLPRRKDALRRMHFDPAEVQAWAARNNKSP